jgi:response regulator RpfG family c-di-GMP phosphodiesterase
MKKKKGAPASNDNRLIFIEEKKDVAGGSSKSPWKIMIVDDEDEIHNVTKMVLKDVVYKRKGLKFIHAFTASEAISLMDKNPDTAIILLDVVMEKDDAGLNVIKHIRDILHNKLVRIVIRTGQPGEAPEKKVIVEYDINDYREKTELTSQKLFSTIIASLRSYESLLTIDINRKGLEKIIEASARLMDLQSSDRFAYEVLRELKQILVHDSNSDLENISGFVIDHVDGQYIIKCGIGIYQEHVYKNAKSVMKKEIIELIEHVVKGGNQYYFKNNRYIGYFKSKAGFENIIFLQGREDFKQSDKYLIEILGTTISSIYDNICLTKEIEDTQKEILFTLGEVVESRSLETINHVRRVAEYSKLIALQYGLQEKEAELIKEASPMHDVGKVGILDSILHKPSKLDDEEFHVIKKHTTIGYDIFKRSERKLLKAAAIIALQHHERFDGKGYPRGLKGEEIHIYGRITCLADIFDALGSDSVYKKAWPMAKILDYIKQQRGKIFDPKLVDIFFDNLEAILKIKKSLS